MSLRVYPFIGLAAVLAGCDPRIELSAMIGIRLPQTAAELEHIRVRAVQNGQELEAVETDGLVWSFEVLAGVTVELSTVLVNARAGGIDAYAGSTSVTPTAGAQDVPLEAAQAEVVAIIPDLRFADTHRLLPDHTVQVALQLDDGEVAGEAAFNNQAYELPAGYDVRFSAELPDRAPVVVVVPITAGSTSVGVDLGASPDAPQGLPHSNENGVVAADLLGAPGYTMECSSMPCATAVDADFEDCATLRIYATPGFLEGPSPTPALAVRYQEVEGSCVDLFVKFDRTPPDLRLRLDPPFLAPGAAPRQLLATLEVQELVDVTSFSVTLDGGPDVCDAIATSQPTVFTCPIDLSGSAGLGAVTVVASVSDLSGNVGSLQTTWVDLSQTPSPGFHITRFEPFPALPAANAQRVPIRMEVANYGASPDCFRLDPPVIVQPAVTPWRVNAAPLSADLDPGVAIEHWLELYQNGSSSSASAGLQTLSFDLYDCVPMLIGTFDFQVDIRGPDVRWLTDEPLYFGAIQALSLGTAQVGSFGYNPPMRGGVGDLSGKSGPGTYSLVSGDPGILQVISNLSLELHAQATGSTYLTLHNNGVGVTNPTADAVPVMVAPAPDIAFLDAGGQVGWIETSAALAGTPTPAITTATVEGLGAPVALLWDGSRGNLIAVRTHGVDRDVRSGGNAVGGPICGANLDLDTIVSAAVTAAGPNHSRPHPGLALLVDAGGAIRHCELDLDDGTEIFSVDLATVPGLPAWAPLAPQCRGKLVANAVTGDMAVVGLDTTSGGSICALTYHTRSGAVVPMAAAIGPDSLASLVRQVAYDPFQNLAVAVLDSGEAYTLSLGGQLRFRTFALNSPGGQHTAAAMDVFESAPVLAGDYQGTTSFLQWNPDHFLPRTGFRSGLRTALYARPTAVAVDSTIGLAVVGDDIGRLTFAVAHEPGTYNDLAPGVEVSDISDAAIVDLVIAGPQPLFVTPKVAAPGDVVSLSGLGFAPGASAVHLNGMSAPVIASTTTSILFRVPEAFQAMTYDTFAAVTVRNFPAGSPSAPGIVSGKLRSGLSIRRKQPTVHEAQPRISLSIMCGPRTCDFAPLSLLHAPFSDPLVLGEGGLQAFSLFSFPTAVHAANFPPGFAPNAVRPVSAVHNHRVIALSGAAWYDARLFDAAYDAAYELSATPAPASDPVDLRDGNVVAIDRAGLTLVVQTLDGELHVVAAPTGAVRASGPGPFGGEAGQSFALLADHTSVDGKEPTGDLVLLVARANGELAARRQNAADLDPVGVVRQGDPSCAIGPRQVAAVSPFGPGAHGTVGLWDALGPRLEVFDTWCGGGQCYAACRDQLRLDHDAGAPPRLAVSPRGDLLATGTTVATYFELRVHQPGGALPILSSGTVSPVFAMDFDSSGSYLHIIGAFSGETLTFADGPLIFQP